MPDHVHRCIATVSPSTGVGRRAFIKRVGVVLGSMAVAPQVLAACGDGDGSGSSEGTLDFWWNASVESSEEMTRWMNQVIKDFEAENSGTQIESVIQPPEQLIGNFQTACQSKSGPSLQFQYAGPYTMQFVWQQCVSPLDDLISQDELDHIAPQEALAGYNFQDQLWALPWFNAPVALMYNKALFAKAGLDPEAPPATLDELLEASQKLRAKGVVPFGYGLKNLTGVGNFSNLWNMQQLDDPSEMLPVVLGDEAYTSPQYSEWMEWVAQLMDAGVFNDDVTSLEYTDAQNMFVAEKSAIAITSTLTTFREALGDDLGVMAPPAIGAGGLAGKITYNPHPLFITAFADDKELAAQFLVHLHTPDALDGMYESSGFFPADDRFDPAIISTPQDQQLYDLTLNQSSVSYQNYWPPQMDRENVFLGVQDLFAGARSPADAAADIEDRLSSWRESQVADLENFQEYASA